MFLTIINNEVIFDFSEINTSTLITNPDYHKASQAREFLRNTSCTWEPTESPQIFRMVYEPIDWATPYGSAKKLKFLLSNCEVNATYLNAIEITPEFELYLIETEKRCQELLEIEIAKEKEIERQAKWENLCKYGCGNCKNLCYTIDIPVCKKTGEVLREINSPIYSGNVLNLFNLIPIPSNNCDYKDSGAQYDSSKLFKDYQNT